MYRETKRAKKFRIMREVKERKRIDSAEPREPIYEPPELRRMVIVIDFDFGKRVNIMRLYRTNRIDSYRAVANGEQWKERIGWSNICKGLSVALPRLASPYR